MTALPMFETFGRALYAVLSCVPALTIAASSTGRAPPWSQMFWPLVEYRNSCQRRGGAGGGGGFLIAVGLEGPHGKSLAGAALPGGGGPHRPPARPGWWMPMIIGWTKGGGAR